MQSYKLIIYLLLAFCIQVKNAHAQKSYALFIGANNLNDDAYEQKHPGKHYSIEAVSGVVYDLEKMNKLLNDPLTEAIILYDSTATTGNVTQSMRTIGRKIKANDYFFIFYSGHGDVVPDKSGDEASGYDQVFVLYDNYLLDDSVHSTLKKYFQNTNNIMIVDACHSATLYKHRFYADFEAKKTTAKKEAKYAQEINETKNSELIQTCKYEQTPATNEPYKLIYYGATKDAGTAYGNSSGGFMTNSLYKIYSESNYITHNWNTLDYRQLACKLSHYMETAHQTLQYHEIGTNVQLLVKQTPFKTTQP